MKKFDIKRYFLIFMMSAIIGWVMEVLLALFCHQKFINRGVLLGPYLPIYGAGCVIIILLLKRYKKQPVKLVLLSMLVCSILEYITSYILEVVFHTRWWDYKDMLININGRVCLETTIVFGIMSIVVMYVIEPTLNKFIDRLSKRRQTVTATLLLFAISLDMLFTFSSMLNIRQSLDGNIRDTTEQTSTMLVDELKEKFNKIKYIFN